MPSKRLVDAGARVDPNATERLLEAVEALTQQVQTLTDHVQIVHQVLDEVRDDLGWLMNNREEFRLAPSITHLTSASRDPLAEDFGDRLNRLTAEDLPEEECDAGDPEAGPVPAPSAEQGDLWR